MDQQKKIKLLQEITNLEQKARLTWTLAGKKYAELMQSSDTVEKLKDTILSYESCVDGLVWQVSDLLWELARVRHIYKMEKYYETNVKK